MAEKNLVLFYSWSGNTRRIAHLIAGKLGADIQEIQPKQPYPADYGKVLTQAKKELQNQAYPPLNALPIRWEQYETICLGTPNWFSTMAPPVASFLWETMPTEKTIFPFCTHGGGGEGRIAKDITDYCLGCDVLPMLTVCGDGGAGAEDDVVKWLNQMQRIIQMRKEPTPIF